MLPKDSFSMRPFSPQKTQHWLHPWMTIGTHHHDGNSRTSPMNKSTRQYKKWNHSKWAEREWSQIQYWYMPEKISFHTLPHPTKQLTLWIITHRNGCSQKQSSSKTRETRLHVTISMATHHTLQQNGQAAQQLPNRRHCHNVWKT